MAMLVRWRVGGQINAEGSDCLFPLFTHCHFGTLLKDGGSTAASAVSQLDLNSESVCLVEQRASLGGGRGSVWRVKWEYERAEDLSV